MTAAPLPGDDGAHPDSVGHEVLAPVATEEDLFRLTYRLIEDLQRVRLSHGNRIRQVLPLIPTHINPPRGTPTWESFFKVSADILNGEEHRVLKLAERLLKDDPIGRWMLAQKGIGPALAVSILGECWPIRPFVWPGGCRVGHHVIRFGDGCKHEDHEAVDWHRHVRNVVVPVAVGDLIDPFPGVRSLWAFAGLHVDTAGKAMRRRKGVKANWNNRLKTRLWVFASSVLKAGGPWRDLYDTWKAYEYAKVGAQYPFDSHQEDAPDLPDAAGAHMTADDQGSDAPGHDARGDAHWRADSQRPNALPPDDLGGSQTTPVSQYSCDSAEPVAPGDAHMRSDGPMLPVLSKGHLHNRAIRYVEKALLKDLWRVAHGQAALVGGDDGAE